MPKKSFFVSVLLSLGPATFPEVSATSPTSRREVQIDVELANNVNQNLDNIVRAAATLTRAKTIRPSQSEAQAESSHVAIDIPATPSCAQCSSEEKTLVSGGSDTSADNNADNHSASSTRAVQAGTSAESAEESENFDPASPVQQTTPKSAAPVAKRPKGLRRLSSAPDLATRRSRIHKAIVQEVVQEESSGSIIPFRRSRALTPTHSRVVTPTHSRAVTPSDSRVVTPTHARAVTPSRGTPSSVNRGTPSNQAGPSRLSRLVTALGLSESSRLGRSSRSSRVGTVLVGAEAESAHSPTTSASSHRDEFFHQCMFCLGQFENENTDRRLQKDSRITNDPEESTQSDTQCEQCTQSEQKSEQSESEEFQRISQTLSEPAIITPCGHKFHAECLRKDIMLKLMANVKRTGGDPLMRRNPRVYIPCPHPFCKERLELKSWAVEQNLINNAFNEEYKKKIETALAEIRRDRNGRIITSRERDQNGEERTFWQRMERDLIDLSATAPFKLCMCLACIFAVGSVGLVAYCAVTVAEGKSVDQAFG